MRILVADELYMPPPMPYALARDRLITALTSAGHEIEFLFRRSSATRPTVFGSTPSREGIQAAERAHCDAEYDLIYVPMFDSETVGALLASSLGCVPIVVACRGPNVTYSLTCGRSLWLPIAPAVRFIAPSVELADQVRGALGDGISVAVVPNGYRRPSSLPVSRQGVRRQLGVPADARVCLIPGIVRREHAITDLLEQLALRNSGNIDLLGIAGAAPDKDRLAWLQAFAERRRFPFPVRVFGGMLHLAVQTLSATVDWCIFPAGTEGGRSAILEAALMGTPVVVPASATHASLSTLPWVATVPDATADSLADVFCSHCAELEPGDPNSAAHLFTVDAECDASLHQFSEAIRLGPMSRPKLSSVVTHWAERLPAAPQSRTFPLHTHTQPRILVMANAGDEADDEPWMLQARDASDRAAGFGIRLHWLLGAPAAGDRDWVDVYDQWSSDELLRVDRRWIERATLDLVVLLEEICRQRQLDCLIAYGIRQASHVAAIVASRYSIPFMLVTNRADVSQVWSKPRQTDRWTVHFADAILWHDGGPPFDIPGFVRQEEQSEVYLRHSLPEGPWSPLIQVLPRFGLQPRHRLTCEFIS